MIRNHLCSKRKMPWVLAQVALILIFITCAGLPAGAKGWRTPDPKTELTEVTAFGGNPGNLKMYMYAPADIADNAPLVVVLHGCTQNASEYSEDRDVYSAFYAARFWGLIRP